jgi:pimeloyl-ACP methyl ester carboxylesterase
MELYYRKEGTGNPLIIIHGLYGSSDNWLMISKKLAERYTVYTVDLRNHGRSPHHEDHSYQAIIDDLSIFFDYHKLEPAVIIGHSMGGKAAMLFAADYPEKVSKLIIVDIAPKDYLNQEEESQYYLHRSILQAMMGIDFAHIETRKEVEDALSEKIDNERIIQFLLKNIVPEKKTRRLKWRLNVEALYNNLEEIIEGGNYRKFVDRLPITNYPVVFIRGLDSPYIKEDDIDLIKKIYPEVNLVDIPNAGHWLHAEQPEMFLEAVLQCC